MPRSEEDNDAYKTAEWETLFERFEEYVKAIIINEDSIHVEDSVRLSELRKDLIESLVRKEFDV